MYFKPYEIKATLSWYNKNPVHVYNFSYSLTQYTPSIYSDVVVIFNNEDFNEFKKIDRLDIADRKIEVIFIPELYSNYTKTKYYPGPYKFVVLQYSVSEEPNHYRSDFTKYETSKKVILRCVDPVFYNMSLNKKYKSYKNMKASDVVNKIVTENGGKIKLLVNTDYKYTWLQPQMTDYTMIRSLLPYSRADNKDILYTFFMLNEECYYAPISHGKKEPTSIALERHNEKHNFDISFDLKLLIEKFGAKDSLELYHHGYSNYENKKPEKMNVQSHGGNTKGVKQHPKQSIMMLENVFEDKTLQEIFISNLRHRIHTFSRILKLSIPAIPDLKPIDIIELVHDVGGILLPFDNLYYIISVSYSYPMNNASFQIPMMHLYLSTDLDIRSTMNPEGRTVA